MRSFLTSIVAVTVAIGGLTAANLVSPIYESAALAAKAPPTKTKKKRSERRSVPHTTGFEHQQCSVQDPCSTRNQW